MKEEKNFYLEDILSQDREMECVLEYYRTGEMKERLAELKQLSFQRVIFSGMGSSHFCAYGADILLSSCGISSKVISTGELIYYEKECLKEGTLLCLISQSGESAEIKHLLELIDEKISVIGVTNREDSTLGKRADICFPLKVSDEISVTTRTYQSSLFIVQLIATVLSGGDADAVLKEYGKTICLMKEYLPDYEGQMKKCRDFCRNMEVISLIGRGNALSSVRAGALFLREVAKFPAIDFDSAEFRHGPMEMVQEGFYGIVFAPSGCTQELNVKLAADIADKGGRVVLITDERADRELISSYENILPVVLPEAKEYASQLLQIIPVQLLANITAEEKGIPAGVFRWGSKIMTKE